MADDDTKPDPKGKDGKPDQGDLGDAGKKALEAERKARRDAERKASDLEAKLAKIEGAGKDENQKLSEQLASLQKDLADRDLKLVRSEVAAEHKLDAARAKYLTGTTREDLEASASQILADFPIPEKVDEKDDGKGGGDKRPPSRKPEADLKGGLEPDNGPTETDPAKLAASVPRL